MKRMFIDQEGKIYKADEAADSADLERMGADAFMMAALTDVPQAAIDVEAKISLLRSDPELMALAQQEAKGPQEKLPLE